MADEEAEQDNSGRDGLLSHLLEAESLELLNGTGADFIEQIGLDVIRDIVLDVLTGKNLRDSTEAITRRRLSAWPQSVAEILKNTLGFEHELVTMNQNAIEDYLREKLRAIPIENFLKGVQIANLTEIEASSPIDEQ
jgi:hypothetical protein